MRITISLLVFFICSIGITSAQSKQLKMVLEQLQIKESACKTELVKESIIPFDKSKSLIFIPKISYQDESSFSCDVYLIVFEIKTGKILHRFYEPNGLWSDAIRCDEVLFDFAPYQLDNQTRAFGVRLKFSNDSRPNPYMVEKLSLFVTQNEKLICVLKDYLISEFTGETDGDCQGKFDDEKKILILDNSQTTNYCDIIIKSKITTTELYEVKGDCKEKKSIRNSSLTRLKFQNGTYKLK